MIFWKHIKGLSPNSLYTFLRFNGSSNNISAEITSLPEVFVSSSSVFSIGAETTSCGYMLTSGMINGYLDNSFTFKNDVHFISVNPGNFLTISFDNPNWVLETNPNQSIRITNNAEIGGTLTSQGDVSITDTTTATNPSTGALKVTGGVGIGDNLYVENEVIIGDKCEANYFNATSDYRAKKDFKLLDIDALELIKKVQLYSFKYKESNQPSIGIIAQDVQDININGFELVDNKEASGANFDYMSIHESKLVYILWKAIQEQQKEIEELKKLIK